MNRTVQRWVKFNVVGIAGVLIQLLTLGVFVGRLHADIMPATFVAVEAAILHNFFWHEKWTWSDRTRRGHLISRFVQFNTANGAVSIAGNLLLMRILVTSLNLNYVVANIAAIGACSTLNFLSSEFLVFAPRPVRSHLKPNASARLAGAVRNLTGFLRAIKAIIHTGGQYGRYQWEFRLARIFGQGSEDGDCLLHRRRWMEDSAVFRRRRRLRDVGR